MSVGSAVDRGRRAAEARMTSRCTIHRLTGATTTDSNGNKVPAWSSVETDIPVRMDSLSSKGAGGYRAVTIGEAQFEVEHVLAHLPADVTDVLDRDLLEITTGELTGRTYQVIEAGSTDQKTARRAPVFEVPVPTGLA